MVSKKRSINKKTKLILIMVFMGMMLLSACNGGEQSVLEDSSSSETELILATTTSTENSGLLDYILPDFKEKHGLEVKVVAVGSGAALQMGVDGEADVLLAHAKVQEEQLVAAGHGIERFDVMYNDFILVGPAADPAGLKTHATRDILTGLKLISDQKVIFVSRGDNSGTHIMEMSLWQEMGMSEPVEKWYLSTGQGMGDVLQIANEVEGYALTDRGTYLSMRHVNDLAIIIEGDARLFNQYGVIAVNPGKGNHINGAGAALFVEWILSEETQKLIAEYGMEKFGMPLFFPNAQYPE